MIYYGQLSSANSNGAWIDICAAYLISIQPEIGLFELPIRYFRDREWFLTEGILSSNIEDQRDGIDWGYPL